MIRHFAAVFLCVPALGLAVACSDPEPETVDYPVASLPPAAPAAAADPCNEKGGAQLTLRASAPLGINEAQLGKPSDQHFETIAGEAGKSLFPDAKVRTAVVNSMENKFESIETTRGFDANVGASYMGFGVGVSGGRSTTKRFASYSATQIAEVREIDESTTFRTAPPGATWYLARIFYGHQYTVVFSGDQRKMNIGVKASYMGYGGGVKKFTEENEIESNAIGRGMSPANGAAIFAKTPEEIKRAYVADGPPVPIYVEYRSIPRACVPPDEQIKWLSPMRVRLTFDSIDVYSKGGDCWLLDAKCTINDTELALTKPQIWSEKRSVEDGCKSDVVGPRGNGNYCPYNLYYATPLSAMDGDIINCGVQGKHGNGGLIPYSQFTYRVKGGAAASFKGDFGDGGNGVEYRVHYGLELEPVIDPMPVGTK